MLVIENSLKGEILLPWHTFHQSKDTHLTYLNFTLLFSLSAVVKVVKEIDLFDDVCLGLQLFIILDMLHINLERQCTVC